MLRRCLIFALLMAFPLQAAVIWLEIGSAGSPAQNPDGGTLTQSDIDGLVFAVKDSGGSVISTASPAGLDEAGAGHFIGVIHLGDIAETAVTLQLRRLVDKLFATAGSGTALLDDFEPQVDPATYKITAASLTWAFTNANPVATDASFTTDEDTPLNGSVAGTDADGDPLTFTLVSGSVTLAADGAFTYAPPADFAGSATFSFTVNDGFAGSATGVATIVVKPVNDPPIANSASITTAEDAPVIGAISGSDIESAISFSLVSGNATIAADGAFTYTPVADFAGADSFVFRVSDGDLSNTATVAVTVTPVNDAPVTLPSTITVFEDTPYLDGVAATDVDSAPLAYSAVSGSVTILSTGAFTYTPPLDSNAPDTFVFRASDGDLSNSATVTVTIVPINDAPIAQPGAFTTAEDTALFGTVTVTDVDGPSASYFLLSGPVTLSMDGAFTYLPPADFAGSDSFTFRVSDGALSTTASVTLTVTPVNDSPIAIDDSFSVVEGEILSANILSNDQDADLDALSAILVGTVSSGSLTLTSDGSFTYLPPANFSGSDRFTYRATDTLANSTIAEVIIEVTKFNGTPVALPDFYVTNEDTPLAVVAASGVLANDFDVEASELSMQLVANVTRGSLSFQADGAFTYVPHANTFGTDAFTYRASDGQLASMVATAHITINPINDAPSADTASFTTAEDTLLTGSVTGSDTEGTTLSFSLIAGSVTLATDGSFTYLPPSNFLGSISFSFRVNDGIANSAPAQVIIVVDSPPILQLIGEAFMRVPPDFNFVDPGAHAYDDTDDADLSNFITVEGFVDTGLEAIYDLSYRVTDSLGLESIVLRQVEVISAVIAQEYVFGRGWNLISVPGVPDLPIVSMFGSDCQPIVFADGASHLQPGDAYWAFLRRPCVVDVVVELPQSVSVDIPASNFHFLGPVSASPWPGIKPPIIIWYWLDGRFARQDPALPMQPGRGYIVALDTGETVVLRAE
jgi:hypothetical protein